MATVIQVGDYEAVVDDGDAELVSQCKWRPRFGPNTIYADASVPARLRASGRKVISMHRLILAAPPGSMIDHVDLNGLNCQRANLRFCNSAQNAWNRPRHPDGSSIYKGVSWNKATGKWRAQMSINERSQYIGEYATQEEAAHAYDAVAIEHRGDFARLNFGAVGQLIAALHR